MILKLFRLYSKKSLNRNKIFKYACMVSVILAVSIIFAVQIVMNVYEKNTYDRMKLMNGTNVKILDRDYLEHYFDKEQLELLRTEGNEECTLGYCDDTNIIFNQTVDSAALTIFNNSNIILGFGTQLKPGELALSNNIAKRLNIKKGDDLYVKLHSSVYADTKFKVAQILQDSINFSVAGSEFEVAQETLGNVYLVLPDFEKYNLAYVENYETAKIQMLKNQFSPNFDVRTLEDLEGKVLPRIEMQISILKLISGIAMMISSICLVWCFLIFIMDRKDDFLILKKIGIKTTDLLKLVLVELYSVVMKGTLIGLLLGGIVAFTYLCKSGTMHSITMYLAIKSVLITLFLILTETMAFALIPLERVKNIIEKNDRKNDKIHILTILEIGIIMLIVSCIYVKSAIGIFFFVAVSILFSIFYVMLILLSMFVIKIMAIVRRRDFLFIKEMKDNLKISSFSYTLINISMVICVVLVSALPMLYTSIEEGTTSEKKNISYKTMQQTEQESILLENKVEYQKYYAGAIKIVQVNGVNIEQCVNKEIAEDYREESIDEISKRSINIYDDRHIPEELETINGVYINNIYRNVIDFKQGDKLTLEINNSKVVCQVGGVYQDAKTKDTLGIVSEAFIKESGLKDSSKLPIIYTLFNSEDADILKCIMLKDKNAYIEQNELLVKHMQTYIDNQKVVLINDIIAIGFSGVLLVFLGQIILFARKRDYHNILWKIGMDKRYLFKNMVIEKVLYSVMQVCIISMFFEPIRFLIVSEMTSSKNYSLSVPILLMELLIVLGINFLSVAFLFIQKRQ